MVKKNNIEGNQEEAQEVIVEEIQEQEEVNEEQVIVETIHLNEDAKSAIVNHTLDKLLDRQDGKKLEGKEHFIEPYKKAYPNEKLFYVTSDKQVFLSGNKADAKRHQKGLKSGEIETIKVK